MGEGDGRGGFAGGVSWLPSSATSRRQSCRAGQGRFGPGGEKEGEAGVFKRQRAEVGGPAGDDVGEVGG